MCYVENVLISLTYVNFTRDHKWKFMMGACDMLRGGMGGDDDGTGDWAGY